MTEIKYEREVNLVDDFLTALDTGMSPWGKVELTQEWDYRSGITDVLVRTLDGHLVAFEAKLSNWRKALHQAYRNTSFAKKAYVVLPAKTVRAARAHPEMFQRYGVGLCSVQNNCVSIIIEAPVASSEPLVPWLHKRAHDFFDDALANESAKRHPAGDLQAA